MRVLMISTDRKILEENSAVRQRVVEYGSLVNELHIVIFNSKKVSFGDEISNFQFPISNKISNDKSQIQNGDGTNFASQNSSYRNNTDNRRHCELCSVAEECGNPASSSFVAVGCRLSAVSSFFNPASLQIPNTNIWLYPTNSKNRWFYIFDAIKISKEIFESRGWKVESGKNEILVSCQDPFETGLVGWWIAKKTDAKLQLQIHTDFLSKYFKRESLLNRIRVMIAKFIIPKADSIRVVSERIKEKLTAYSPQLTAKIVTLPIFIDIDKIKNTPTKFNLHQKYPQFDFVMLVASRLEKEKNIEMVIEAFAEVVKKHPKTGLVIVGNGSREGELKLKTKNLKLTTNVIFEGWSNDLISYYKTADLFLLPSNYEGFGMTLVEATVSGCPILTTRVGIVGEILNEENSLICPVGDEKCFSQKMLWAIENKEKLTDLNQKAKIEIQNKLTKTKEKYLEEYKQSWEIML